MILILVIPIALYLAWISVSRPFYGLLITFAIYPIDFLVELPKGLAVGRLAGMLAVLGWIIHLSRRGGILHNFKNLKTTVIVSPFVFVCFLGVVFHGAKPSGLLRCVTIAVLALLSMMTEDMIRNEKRIKQLIWVLLLSSLFISILPVSQYFGLQLPALRAIQSESSGGGMRISGITENPNGLALISNTAAFLLALLILQSRSLLKMLALSSLAGIALMAMILSGSRTHFVGILAFLAFLALFRLIGPMKGILKYSASVIAVGLIFAFAVSHGSSYLKRRLLFIGEGRTSVIKRLNFAKDQRNTSVSLLMSNPFTGVGLGNFIDYQTSNYRMADAHDTVSSLLGETGGLGLLAFLFMLFTCIKRIFRALQNAAKQSIMNDYYFWLVMIAILSSMIVSGFGGYIMFYQRLFWLIIGLSALAVMSTTTKSIEPPLKDRSKSKPAIPFAETIGAQR